MINGENKLLTHCNSSIKTGGVERFSTALFLSFLFITSAFATTTTPEINAEYLNELTGPKVTWETATEFDSDIVLINGAYYKYTYHKPDDYTETGKNQGSHYQRANSAYSYSIYGAATANNPYPLGPVIGDFINYGLSGQVFKDMSGNIVAAQSAFGGAIAVLTPSVGSPFSSSINGLFMGNFVKTSTQSPSTSEDVAGGGAIYNETNLKNIVGDFIKNYAHRSAPHIAYGSRHESASGGAIYNTGTINNITGNFIDNYALSPNGVSYGGAIYNNRGNIGDITGDFIKNYAQSTTNRASGGAIYGSGTLTNSSFYGNYAKTGSTDKSKVQGGAIYNSGTLNITANDGKQSIFSGNKIIYKDTEGNDIEESNAIHMAGGTLNLSAVEGGQIIFDDKITANTGNTNPSSLPMISYSKDEVANITSNGFFFYTDENIETFLDAKVAEEVQYGAEASWEQKEGKYIYTTKYGDELEYKTYTTEFTAIDELNGYAGKTYEGYGSFAPSEVYGGDINSYLEGWAADGIENGYTVSYEYKDGVYYITESYGPNEIYNHTITEDLDAGGAWIISEYPPYEWSEIWGPGDYDGDIESYLANNAETFIAKDGYYYAVMNGELVKIDMSIDGYMDEDGNYITKEEAEQIFADAEANGNEVSIVDGVVTISPKLYAGESGVFYRDSNGEIVFRNNLVNNVTFNITGDGTGKVVFNDDIEHDGIINVSNAEVEVNAQGFDRANLKDGSVVNVGNGFVIKDTIINSSSLLKIKEGAKALSTMVADSGTLSVQNGGEADNTVVFSGGKLHIDSNAVASDTTVNRGGMLESEVDSKLNNLLANGGAILDIDAGSVLTGNIIIDANAEMGGSYDYSKIFKDEVTDSGSLTLVGGLNNAMTSDSLINNVADKKLNLTSGDYSVGYGAQTVSGWDSLTISDANVKVEGVIDMAEASKVINITSNSTLDLAGHSPLVTTIIGSLNNDGTLNFHHADDDADDITNIYGNYTAYNNAQMVIDVNPSTKSSDLMIVDGDVAGTTKVTVYRITDGTTTDLIKFVDAPNDDTSTGAYFTVHRVYAEALDITDQWKIVHQDNAWHITSANNPTNSNDGYGTSDTGDLDVDIVTDVTLPNNFPTSPTITPNIPTNNQTSNNDTKTKLVSEALAYISLPKIGLEQVRDLVRIVSNKVTSSKIMSGRCGMGECNYDGQAVNGAWIDLGHKKSEIDAPIAIEAKINAVDLGFDIQKDLHNRLGIFASYRQGEYELSGDGEDYYAKEGADIDIDSWILGLYHRYDYGRLWTMSSIYGGIQKVDMNTDDGVSADTDGIQFGGSVEAGLVFEPQKRLTIEPSIRLGYNFIKYDDMSDSYGKKAEFDNVQNIEAEAGVKVEKTFFHNNRRVISKIYVKPSIIQNFGKGDVNITSLDTVEGLENETLIRGEIGGSFNFGNGWSGFGSLGYTYGSDYDATDFNLGVNYNW